MSLLLTVLDGEEVDAATLVMAATAYNWTLAVAYAMHRQLDGRIVLPKVWEEMSDSEKLAWVRLARRWLL